jgi:hypothetical protein
VPRARDLSAAEAGKYSNPYPAGYPITNKKTLGTAPPVLNAVVVGGKSVLDPP